MPTLRTPSVPQNPWTEIAPHGSSILSMRSFSRTPTQTTMPASAPIATAELALTNAQGAVTATNPASMPLQAIEISALPKMKYQNASATAEPAQAAKFVLTAITP